MGHEDSQGAFTAAPPNYPLRQPNYDQIQTRTLFTMEVHWAVLANIGSRFTSRVYGSLKGLDVRPLLAYVFVIRARIQFSG